MRIYIIFAFIVVTVVGLDAPDISCDSDEACAAEWGEVDGVAKYLMFFANSTGESVAAGAALCDTEDVACNPAVPRCLPESQEIFVQGFNTDGKMLGETDLVALPDDVGTVVGNASVDDELLVSIVSSSKLNVTWERLDGIDQAEHAWIDTYIVNARLAGNESDCCTNSTYEPSFPQEFGEVEYSAVLEGLAAASKYDVRVVAYGCSDVLYTTPWVQQVTAAEVDNSETTTSAPGTTTEEGYLYILVELNLNGISLDDFNETVWQDEIMTELPFNGGNVTLIDLENVTSVDTEVVFQVTSSVSDARELADNITDWVDDQTFIDVFEGLGDDLWTDVKPTHAEGVLILLKPRTRLAPTTTPSTSTTPTTTMTTSPTFTATTSMTTSATTTPTTTETTSSSTTTTTTTTKKNFWLVNEDIAPNVEFDGDTGCCRPTDGSDAKIVRKRVANQKTCRNVCAAQNKCLAYEWHAKTRFCEAHFSEIAKRSKNQECECYLRITGETTEAPTTTEATVTTTTLTATSTSATKTTTTRTTTSKSTTTKTTTSITKTTTTKPPEKTTAEAKEDDGESEKGTTTTAASDATTKKADEENQETTTAAKKEEEEEEDATTVFTTTAPLTKTATTKTTTTVTTTTRTTTTKKRTKATPKPTLAPTPVPTEAPTAEPEPTTTWTSTASTSSTSSEPPLLDVADMTTTQAPTKTTITTTSTTTSATFTTSATANLTNTSNVTAAFKASTFVDIIGIGGLVGFSIAVLALLILVVSVLKGRQPKKFLDHIDDELAVQSGQAPRSSTTYFKGDLATEAHIMSGSSYGAGFNENYQAFPGGGQALSRVNPLMALNMDGDGYMDVMY